MFPGEFDMEPVTLQKPAWPREVGVPPTRPTLLFCILALALVVVARGQGASGASTGSISGLVVDGWQRAPMAGAIVTLRGSTVAVTTDASGRYLMSNVPVGDQSLSFSKSGYARVVVSDIRVVIGQTTTADAELKPEFYEMEEYEVTAEELNDQTEQLLIERQSAQSFLEGMGSEQFSRVGAGDVADVVAKLPGITITDGKNPVVRGLNERYVGVLLNGAEVPSADPYRKSVQLDLFPAKLIERVLVNKTFTPDQPGNATGGGVNIITKSFPEQAFINAEVGLEYNTLTTFNGDFLTYQGGGLDWLGMDDGTRALPPSLAGSDLVLPAPVFSSGRPGTPSYEQNLARADALEAYTMEMGVTQFAPTAKAPPPNFGLATSFGDTRQVAGRDLGLFGGITYKQAHQFYDGVSRRYVPGLGQSIQLRRDYQDTRGVSEVTWASDVNLAYQLSEHNQIKFNFLFSQNGEDTARHQFGEISDDPDYVYYLERLQFVERNLTSYQVTGSHILPEALGMKVEWLTALADTSQDEPDARFFHYRSTSGIFEVDHPSIPSPKLPTRYFRELAEGNFNWKLDNTIPLSFGREREGEFKMGGFGSSSERDFFDREIYYSGEAGSGSAYPFTGDPNAYLSPESMGYRSTTNAAGIVRYVWDRYIQSRDSSYGALQDVYAGYAMIQIPVLPRLKLQGGGRYELTDLSVRSTSYLANSITGSTTNSARLDREDFLPAVSLAYDVRTNMSLRFSYSQTIARPSFRELAGYRSYDPVLNELLDGNPTLTMSQIENFDLRWEWFTRPGEVLSVSVFYKDLVDAIEKRYVTLDAEIVSWANREKARAFGVELEARTRLDVIAESLRPFSIGGNIALIASEVELTPEEISAKTQFLNDPSTSRQLYDQSPYILNFDLGYDHERWGTAVTLAMSLFGPRITIAGLTTPDVYEQPAPALDLIAGQRLSKHWKLKFSAKNLLDPVFERTYGEEGSSYLYSSYRKGRSFGLSLSCEF